MINCRTTRVDYQSMYEAAMDYPHKDSIRYMARQAGLKRKVFKKRMRRAERKAVLIFKRRRGYHWWWQSMARHRLSSGDEKGA